MPDLSPFVIRDHAVSHSTELLPSTLLAPGTMEGNGI